MVRATFIKQIVVYCIVFIAGAGIALSQAQSVTAADVTIDITPDNAAGAGAGQRNVVLQNPSGFEIQSYEIIVSVDSTVVTLQSATDGTPLPLPQGVGARAEPTFGNAGFQRFVNDNGTGGTNATTIAVGTVTYSASSASTPLFQVSEATVIGVDTSGNSRLLTVATGASVPLATPTPVGGLTPTVTPGPLVPECNLCGYCKGGTVPTDYAECVACVYSDPGNLTDPSAQAPQTPIEGVEWTIFGCMESGVAGYTQQWIIISTAAVGGLSFVLILFGGYLILTSQGSHEKLRKGRKLIITGVSAALLVFFAVAVLQNVGFEILRIPGF